jgi:hypothetical protein
LRDAGWTVLRFWEHDSPLTAADSIEAVVRGTVLSPDHLAVPMALIGS